MNPTKIEHGHYQQLEGKTIARIHWEELEGRALPVLVFQDGSAASVLCDPEGNGVGFLSIEEPGTFKLPKNLSSTVQ